MSLAAAVRLRRGQLVLDVELDVATAEMVAVVGPNGAGKTTLLRALSGLDALDAGRVTLDDVVLEDVDAGIRLPPERRSVGVVFQDYALFPHLSALENVAFGLRARGAGRGEARRVAQEWLERVGLDGHRHERPHALSGGQAQRVALARALVTRPRLLLLDEPLSATDVRARAALRRELRAQLGGFDGTSLLVTHDPVEALALADRLVVLEQGRVVQTGSADDVRARPRSRYVAELVGVNLFRGVARRDRVELAGGAFIAVADAGDGDVFAVVHPRAVALHLAEPEGSPRNSWPGVVDDVDDEGERARVRVRVSAALILVAEVTSASVRDLALAPGRAVWATVKATEVAVYPA